MSVPGTTSCNVYLMKVCFILLEPPGNIANIKVHNYLLLNLCISHIGIAVLILTSALIDQ